MYGKPTPDRAAHHQGAAQAHRRHSTGLDDPALLATMDQPKICGPRRHTYSHADAIDDGVLADYQLVVPTVTDTELHTALTDPKTGPTARRTTAPLSHPALAAPAGDPLHPQVPHPLPPTRRSSEARGATGAEAAVGGLPCGGAVAHRRSAMSTDRSVC